MFSKLTLSPGSERQKMDNVRLRSKGSTCSFTGSTVQPKRNACGRHRHEVLGSVARLNDTSSRKLKKKKRALHIPSQYHGNLTKSTKNKESHIFATSICPCANDIVHATFKTFLYAFISVFFALKDWLHAYLICYAV